jgi:hypothetical protein
VCACSCSASQCSWPLSVVYADYEGATSHVRILCLLCRISVLSRCVGIVLAPREQSHSSMLVFACTLQLFCAASCCVLLLVALCMPLKKASACTPFLQSALTLLCSACTVCFPRGSVKNSVWMLSTLCMPVAQIYSVHGLSRVSSPAPASDILLY